jgi:hypothetical protein
MFTSESQAEDSRIAATDQAQVIRGKGTLANAPVVSGKNSLLAGLNLAGLKLGSKSTLNVTVGDTTGVEKLLQDVGKSTQDTVKQALDQSSVLVKDALASVSKSTESQQTGGLSSQPVLLVMLGVLTLIGFVFYYLRK